MFFEKQSDSEKNKYALLLRIIGSLSRLSSDNYDIPYLYYRMAENIFCRAFSAKNLSRSDISLDASKNHIGVGLKTFVHRNGQGLEKIAEFNKERNLYAVHEKNPEHIIKIISEYRNQRIIATGGICGIDITNMLYHCVSRASSVFYIYETPLELINTSNIKFTKKNENTIYFNDDNSEYCFNLSKSTLYKRFNIEPIHEIPVKILENPFDLLEKYLSKEFEEEDKINKVIDTVYLPLYSERGEKHVPEKSGLNQWNAGGRKRHQDEVYIPIPRKVHEIAPEFFPSRDESFSLHLPDGRVLCAKVCQDGSKALMSDPNKSLGEWLLRDVFNLKYNELLTYDKLEEIGIDSVQINKFEDNTYEINFKGLGSYDNFITQTIVI